MTHAELQAYLDSVPAAQQAIQQEIAAAEQLERLQQAQTDAEAAVQAGDAALAEKRAATDEAHNAMMAAFQAARNAARS